MSNQDPAESAKNAEKFVVRLPLGMRRRIAEAARGYRRSMNSEIVARLEQTLSTGANNSFTAPEPLQQLPHPSDRERADPAAQREIEIQLLRAFRLLPRQRQQALLDLLLD